MCGIAGIVRLGRSPRDRVWVEAACAAMFARGPDGEGVADFERESWTAVLGHRRLAVVAPGPEGAQPMASPCGRWVITYNGELYNDAEVRRSLAGRWAFRTQTDTETVLAAVATWGLQAGARLRGMFALAVLDTRTGTLTLGRDVMGIKPLFFAAREDALAFASVPVPVAAWVSGGKPKPDPVGVASYLSTIRTTLGTRTMFESVRTLRPGEWLELAPSGRVQATVIHTPMDVEQASGRDVRSVVTDSVRTHLRSDVPLCCLLSGGLDSTIIAAIASRELGSLHTYCAGAEDGPEAVGEDFAYAERVAAILGTKHTRVGVSREAFHARVPELVRSLGVPLSTPNEVAIAEVARAMRADGKVVTLSGEGADELFGGYDAVLAAAAQAEASGNAPEEFWTSTHAWVPIDGLAHVLTPEAWAACDGGSQTKRFIAETFEAIGREIGSAPSDAVERHLRYQRRVNLEGLLRRLDSATMLASVEGRTPFADARVCAFAEKLGLSEKIRLRSTAGGFQAGDATDSKIALRRAFADLVPAEVLGRKKASFPLPFERWIADLAPRLRESAWLSDLVRPEVIDIVASDMPGNWRLAWPLVNLAIWGDALAEAPRQFEWEAKAPSAGPATRKTVHSSIGTAPSFL
jgi:asparagine synthase (glutamine-hydrolysing)